MANLIYTQFMKKMEHVLLTINVYYYNIAPHYKVVCTTVYTMCSYQCYMTLYIVYNYQSYNEKIE
mgnify:CR=1 FL=1